MFNQNQQTMRSVQKLIMCIFLLVSSLSSFSQVKRCSDGCPMDISYEVKGEEYTFYTTNVFNSAIDVQLYVQDNQGNYRLVFFRENVPPGKRISGFTFPKGGGIKGYLFHYRMTGDKSPFPNPRN